MIRVLSTGASLVTVVVLAEVIASAGAFGARADDPNSGGDITVTVVDPSASASPSPSGASTSGVPSPGRVSGPGSTGGSGTAGSTPGVSSEPGSKATGIPKWVVLGGLGGDSHSEFNPFRGFVRSTVTVANRSTSESVSGVLVFRLHSFLGAQLGPTVTRDITGLRPGSWSTTSVDLDGLAQWPLVKLSVAFEQTGPGHPGSLERESWIAGSPWLLIVIVIAVLAGLAVMSLRRGFMLTVVGAEAVA